jgi:transcriptional regulator with XRE-family HTH domain
VAVQVTETSGNARLGGYLRRLREGYGYTLRRVEERAQELGDGIDNSQLSRFEKGKAVPSFEKLRTLARVFNVPVQQFSDVLDLERYDHLKPTSTDYDFLVEEGQREFREGNFGQAYVIYERCLELAEADVAAAPEAARRSVAIGERISSARLYMAYALKALGKLGMAENELRAILRHRRHLPRSTLLRSLTLLAYTCREQGDAYLASVLAREALELASEDGDLAVQIGILNTLGIIAYQEGSPRRAVEYFERVVRLAQRMGGREEMQVTASIHLGRCLSALGRSESGGARIRAAIHTARKRGYRRSAALGLTLLAEICLDQGKTRRALHYISQSDQVAGDGDPYHDIMFLNAFHIWEIARSQGNTVQERMALGRLKHYRPFMESKFPEVEAFDAFIEGARRRP